MSQDELSEIIKLRWHKRKLPIDSVMSKEDIVDMAHEMGDESEAAALLMEAEKIDAITASHTKAARKTSKEGASGSSARNDAR